MKEKAPPAPAPSILRMAVPLVISFVMRSLFTMVDTVYAATLGDAAVAAIGLTIPLEFLMIASWVGFSNGLTSPLASAMGARECGRIRRLLAASRRLTFALMPPFLAIGAAILIFARHLGLPQETAAAFRIYGSILVGGSAFTMFWSVIPDSIVKAHQDTRSTMWAGIFSNIVNLVLNTIFLFVFHWGIFGIAFSTVLGRFGGLIYALGRARQHEQAREERNGSDELGVEPHPYRLILGLGLPAAATYGLMATESFLVNGLLVRLPHATEALAAYSIYYRVLMLAIMPVIATSVAMLPFAARRFGKGDLPALRQGFREAAAASAAYCLLLMTPVLILLGPKIASALTESDLTRRYATVALWLVPAACLSAIPFILCRPVFEGMQMAKPGLVVALLRYCLMTAPFGFAGIRLAPLFGYPAIMGLLFGLIFATALSSLTIQLWMNRTLKRLPRETIRS